MAQLSRPFQIALVAVVLLAGVWLFALQGHSSSPAGSTSSPAVSASAPATSTASSPAVGDSTTSVSTTAAKPAPAHHGHPSGSSLGGLGHAINQANRAAAITQQHEKQLETKASQGTNEQAPTTTSSARSGAPARTTKAGTTKSAAPPVVRTPAKSPASSAHKGTGAPSTSSVLAKPSGQLAVESDLAKGNVVVLLFWNPAGTDDVVAHRAVRSVSHRRHVAVLQAPASQVASFGSITRGVQVNQTPTILVINKRGQTIVLTGSQDAFSIEQTIAEARS